MKPQEEILAVKRRYARQLLSQPGVVGLDVGEGEGGRPALVVHLETDDPAVRERLPKQIEGYPVRCVQSGPFRKF
jgi:hypothetical protein